LKSALHPTATNCAFEFLFIYLFKILYLSDQYQFFKFGLRTLFVLLKRWKFVKVFVKFQFPKFPSKKITFPITVDFDNYCNFWSSRPHPLSTNFNRQRTKIVTTALLISVKGWFLLQCIVILLNARRFSSHMHLNV
jgi:hypothetical protein